MDCKVKLKFGRTKKTSEEVVNIVLNYVSVVIVGVLPNKSCVILQVSSESDVAKLMDPDFINNLKKYDLTVEQKKDFIAAKSVFINKLTSHFTDHDDEDIKAEISSKNDVNCVSIFRINKNSDNNHDISFE